MATPIAKQLSGALGGFERLYGLELLDYSDTEVRARVTVGEQLKQGAGLVHGLSLIHISEPTRPY